MIVFRAAAKGVTFILDSCFHNEWCEFENNVLATSVFFVFNFQPDESPVDRSTDVATLIEYNDMECILNCTGNSVTLYIRTKTFERT